MRWSVHTINLQTVLLGGGAGWTGGCAGVGGCIRPLSTGDLQLATSRQNPEPLVWLDLRTWNQDTELQYDVCLLQTIQCIMQCPSVLLLLFLCCKNTHIPSFLQVRLGGGMPLDSQTRVMRLPSITVRGDTSSEPRILGVTVMTGGHQKEAHTVKCRFEFSPELLKSSHHCDVSITYINILKLPGTDDVEPKPKLCQTISAWHCGGKMFRKERYNYNVTALAPIQFKDR